MRCQQPCICSRGILHYTYHTLRATNSKIIFIQIDIKMPQFLIEEYGEQGPHCLCGRFAM